MNAPEYLFKPPKITVLSNQQSETSSTEFCESKLRQPANIYTVKESRAQTGEIVMRSYLK